MDALADRSRIGNRDTTLCEFVFALLQPVSTAPARTPTCKSEIEIQARDIRQTFLLERNHLLVDSKGHSGFGFGNKASLCGLEQGRRAGGRVLFAQAPVANRRTY